MTNPMMPVEQSMELAERIRGHMPYLERLRFVNTGSEATRSAVRVARAATGRAKIAKCEGNFHGSDETFLVSTHSHVMEGPDTSPTPVPDYAGMAPDLAEGVVVLPYNDPEASVALIRRHAHELAAVIMEPVAFSSGGGVAATPEFARAVRDVTAGNEIALIFDEVLCAYRMGLAGAPAYLGVTPDLATIGKAVGGGMPLGAFGGRADIMEAALGSGRGRPQGVPVGHLHREPGVRRRRARRAGRARTRTRARAGRSRRRAAAAGPAGRVRRARPARGRDRDGLHLPSASRRVGDPQPARRAARGSGGDAGVPARHGRPRRAVAARFTRP